MDVMEILRGKEKKDAMEVLQEKEDAMEVLQEKEDAMEVLQEKEDTMEVLQEKDLRGQPQPVAAAAEFSMKGADKAHASHCPWNLVIDGRAVSDWNAEKDSRN